MYKFEYDMIVIVKKTCRKIMKRREKMKLSALTSESLITLNNDLQTKEDVIRTLISMLYIRKARLQMKKNFNCGHGTRRSYTNWY